MAGLGWALCLLSYFPVCQFHLIVYKNLLWWNKGRSFMIDDKEFIPKRHHDLWFIITIHFTNSAKIAFGYKECRARGNYHLHSEGLFSPLQIFGKNTYLITQILKNNTSITFSVVSNILSFYNSVLNKQILNRRHSPTTLPYVIFNKASVAIYALIFGCCLSFSCHPHLLQHLKYQSFESRVLCVYWYICLFICWVHLFFLIHYLQHLKLEWALEHNRCLGNMLNRWIINDKWESKWTYHGVPETSRHK